jgi:hypothetical protein
MSSHVLAGSALCIHGTPSDALGCNRLANADKECGYRELLKKVLT